MRAKGIRFAPIFGRQAFKVDGKFKFWGGLTVESVGGGPGLGRRPHRRRQEERHHRRLRAARAVPRQPTTTASRACASATKGKTVEVACKCVVLAAGGFQANAEMAHALPGPRLGARQGARHPLQHRRRHPHGAATSARSRPATGRAAHAVGWDRNAPEFGDLERRRQLPEAQLPLLDHARTPTASASSTRAPTSATTPTPSMAA